MCRATPAQERRLTALAEGVIETLCQELDSASPRQTGNGVDVLLVCSDGNSHTLGIRIMDLALQDLGLSTRVLPKSLTTAEIKGLMLSTWPKILGISAALFDQLEQVRHLAFDFAKHPDFQEAKILVGGAALRIDAGALYGISNVVTASHDINQLRSTIATCLAR